MLSTIVPVSHEHRGIIYSCTVKPGWPVPECGNSDRRSFASWPSLGRPGRLCLALLEGSGWGWVGSSKLALRQRHSCSLLFSQHHIAYQGATSPLRETEEADAPASWPGTRGGRLRKYSRKFSGGNSSATCRNLEAHLICVCLQVWDTGNPLHPQLSYPHRLVRWVLWRERKGLGLGLSLGQNAMERRDQMQEVGVHERQFSRRGKLEQTFHRKVRMSPGLWVPGYIGNRNADFLLCCSIWDGSIESSVIFFLICFNWFF